MHLTRLGSACQYCSGTALQSAIVLLADNMIEYLQLETLYVP
jgi:hypothetical protein